MKGRMWIFFAAMVLVLGLGAWWGLPRLRPYSFHGTVIQSPNPAPDFELTASTGQEVSLQDFRGKLVMLYFGYLFCPDVCPATLAKATKAMELLGEDANQVQFIMVSVDPERDTPERMGEYLSHFDPRFLGVTGSPDDIATIATLYGIYYEKHEGTEATGYLVDHTATVTVIDKAGRLKLIFPFEMSAEDMAEDLSYMLR